MTAASPAAPAVPAQTPPPAPTPAPTALTPTSATAAVLAASAADAAAGNAAQLARAATAALPVFVAPASSPAASAAPTPAPTVADAANVADAPPADQAPSARPPAPAPAASVSQFTPSAASALMRQTVQPSAPVLPVQPAQPASPPAQTPTPAPAPAPATAVPFELSDNAQQLQRAQAFERSVAQLARQIAAQLNAQSNASVPSQPSVAAHRPAPASPPPSQALSSPPPSPVPPSASLPTSPPAAPNTSANTSANAAPTNFTPVTPLPHTAAHTAARANAGFVLDVDAAPVSSVPSTASAPTAQASPASAQPTTTTTATAPAASTPAPTPTSPPTPVAPAHAANAVAAAAIQATGAPSWPSHGTSAPMAALLANLVGQASLASRAALPQQLISAQIWSPALARAVLTQSRGAARTGETALDKILAAIEAADDAADDAQPPDLAPNRPLNQSASKGPALPQAGHSLLNTLHSAQKFDPIAAAPRIPALQTWLEHEGMLEGTDGTRRPFRLRLSVPTLWAHTQQTLLDALGAIGAVDGTVDGVNNGFAPSPSAHAPSAQSPQIGLAIGWPTGLGAAPPSSTTLPAAVPAALRWAGDVHGLAASLQAGVILQSAPPAGVSPNVAAQMQLLRTSALLEIEFGTPSAAQSAQTQAQAAAIAGSQTIAAHASDALPAHRASDGWLHLAQLYAAGAAPRHPPQSHEQPSLCNMAGCQYEGRAVCAQPFCAQMNYLWSVAAPQSRA